ncbi:glycogen synthase [Candidatus Gottesmanbacteria bacterium]|nr:glycogen synthase [Candidatus Gottesmanbacteria bacterium]
MRVLFVTSECAGLFKQGGLGDVSYALPVALRTLGVHMAVALPYYEKIKAPHVACVGQLAVDFDRRRELIFVFKTSLPGSTIPVYLFRHPLFNHYKTANMAEAFAFFSKAVAQFYLYANPLLGGPYDIVHCQDWHTALVPMLIGEERKVGKKVGTLASAQVRTVFTIHNHLYKGETGVMTILKLGLPRSLFHVYETSLGSAIKLMREALEYADQITTVSPTYARELITHEHGDEINAVMKRRANNVVGILNGIDQHRWNPRTDASLVHTYDKGSVKSGKSSNKHALRTSFRLPESSGPLFGFVGRLEFRQKGLDLIMKAVETLATQNFQLFLLGEGSAKSQLKLAEFAKRHGNVRFVHTFDERLARRVYAAADVILVPSKFEPCGLIQMIAQRYGALPLVRKTGGLADSVTDGKTGFVFETYRAGALAQKMHHAIALYLTKPETWQRMMALAMRQDFSWDKSAKEYRNLYRKLLTP